MRGCLGNVKATRAAFRGDWLHSGDPRMLHPGGYIQIRERSKDIPISGGENISSVAVENAPAKHLQDARTFVFTELPKTATGKIRKFALREKARHL